MGLSNTKELQMSYLGLLQTDSALVFSMDGKNRDVEDFQSCINTIVSYVTTLYYNPIIAKIEILDKKENLILALDIPVLPAFLDINNENDIALLNNPNYMKLMQQRAKTLNNGQTTALVTNRTAEYVNYIQHEIAGAYVKCATSGKQALANQIQKLPIMSNFDLSNFTLRGSGKLVYKTPQILKYPTKIEGELFARQYYMGLQEEVSNAEKNKQFWDAVAERDRAYVKLETNMVRVLAELKNKYGEVDFVSDNVSSNYTNPPQKF